VIKMLSGFEKGKVLKIAEQLVELHVKLAGRKGKGNLELGAFIGCTETEEGRTWNKLLLPAQKRETTKFEQNDWMSVAEMNG